jgi:hypothetical protein
MIIWPIFSSRLGPAGVGVGVGSGVGVDMGADVDVAVGPVVADGEAGAVMVACC